MFFYIPSHIYDKFYQENNLDSLAYFFFLKKVNVRKPIFYNWSWKSLNKRTGISINTLKKHIAVLMKEGLVCSKDNHLHILTPKPNKKNKWVYIPVVKGIYNIKTVLKSLHIFTSIARQAKNISKLDTPDTYKLLKKRKSTLGYTSLSNSTIARKINKSISTAQRRKEKLKGLKVLSWRYKYLNIEEFAQRFDNPLETLSPYRFKNIYGVLYIQISNHYTLSFFKKQYITSYSYNSKVVIGRYLRGDLEKS